MTHEQMYEAVRAKVIEACPDATETISLSHVLRAIAGKVDSTACMYPDGIFVEWDSSGDNYYTLFSYDLPSDDLSKQSPEVIKFLYSILVE